MSTAPANASHKALGSLQLPHDIILSESPKASRIIGPGEKILLSDKRANS